MVVGSTDQMLSTGLAAFVWRTRSSGVTSERPGWQRSPPRRIKSKFVTSDPPGLGRSGPHLLPPQLRTYPMPCHGCYPPLTHTLAHLLIRILTLHATSSSTPPPQPTSSSGIYSSHTTQPDSNPTLSCSSRPIPNLLLNKFHTSFRHTSNWNPSHP